MESTTTARVDEPPASTATSSTGQTMMSSYFKRAPFTAESLRPRRCVERHRYRTAPVRNGCDAAAMGADTGVSITWGQALGWRMERHLLDPAGSESVADVVRRLGAILSMDEPLAELAVRARRTPSRPGERWKPWRTGA